MNTSLWIAACTLPLVGGLHRYAVSYGYRGVSRKTALLEAWWVGTCLSVISVLYVVYMELVQ